MPHYEALPIATLKHGKQQEQDKARSSSVHSVEAVLATNLHVVATVNLAARAVGFAATNVVILLTLLLAYYYYYFELEASTRWHGQAPLGVVGGLQESIW